MEYIFFDIECANCFHGRGKICSFGYVITDESFNVIEKNDILMNPHSRFCLTGRKNHPGIVLGYDEDTFNASPDFKHYYSTIRDLLTRPNTLKFGFAVLSDASFLKSECERFSKELFDFDFIDIQRIYTDFKNLENTPGLIKCAHEYGVLDNQEVHKSDDDSFFTMMVLKGLCEETGLTAIQLVERFPHCKCRCMNGEIESEYLKYKEIMKAQKLSKMEKLTGSVRANWIHSTEKNALDFSSYYKRVYVDRSADSYLCGKKVCISSLYEEYHFNEMMNIISYLAKNGAKYTRHAFGCNIFVTYDLLDKNGELYRCYRKDKVDLAISEGKSIEILDISDLLRILGISNEDIQVLDRKALAPLKKRKFVKSI